MSIRLSPYPEYKESGMPWIGKVPRHWEVRRGKTIFKCVDVRSKRGNEELLTVSAKDGVVPRREKKVTMFMAESYAGHKLCWPGDLVINSLWAWAGGLGFSKYNGIISTAYGVYRPQPRISNLWAYFNYLLRSSVYDWEFHVRSKGIWVSRLQLTDESFLEIPIILPPPDEGEIIVKFLSGANIRITLLIRAKHRMIELLNEQKQAIIHRAVTRGLDPNVRLKPSDVEWLEDVPEHWEILSLSVTTESIQTGPFGSQLHASEYITGGIPVINPSHMKNGCIHNDPQISVNEEIGKRLSRHRLQEGDIVAARRGELGRCALVKQEQANWLCGTGSLIVRSKKRMYFPEYLLEVISSQGVRDTLSISSIGATMDNLNAGMMARLRLPCPPIEEQKRTVEGIKLEKSKIDSATNQILREITLLKEYRARLIADVVTGKLDVRGMELPELKEDDLTPISTRMKTAIISP